jgi:Fe-S-cluster containining protein
VVPARDAGLIQIVDAALAGTAARSGDWLACKPGCHSCCIGVFAIHALDAARLQQGLAELDTRDPERAHSVRKRAAASVARLRNGFPGDPGTGLLDETEEAAAIFEDFANDEPCPALDPASGTCDLYSSRPMTCRVFGPPVRTEEGLGVCELCYHGATEEQIAACEMDVGFFDLELEILREVEQGSAPSGRTLVAFALSR